MSVTDPLVKELKEWTLKLIECRDEITDKNEYLIHFCKCIETCFQRGLLVRLNSFGFPKLPEAWYWLEEIADKNHSSALLTFALEVDNVRENLKVQNPVGRLRLLIRACLNKKCLHLPVQYFIRILHLSFLEYYSGESILGNEILCEIFFSVLLQIREINFRLNLRNATFLDDTWQLPEWTVTEFVPCKSLGMSVCFTRRKALIVNLERNSVAGENGIIEVGDVLDEINGNVLNYNNRGKLRKIMKSSSGHPLFLHIIKHRSEGSNNIYPPIAEMIKSSGIVSIRSLSILKSKSEEELFVGCNNKAYEALNKRVNSGFIVKYCGSISTGLEGDVRQIDKAIWRFLKTGDMKLLPVKLECLEMGIKVTRDSDDMLLLEFTYMEISSCGRTCSIPNYFAFISGDGICSVATKFEAHVFFHQKQDEVRMILQSLGQGFKRTHYAV